MNPDKHYAALDGIRGLAAFFVVLFHIGLWLDAPFASNSDLSVDLFFLLSGYVLTLAYAQRLIDGLTIGRFLALRLIRLMPLVILGTLISSAYTALRAYIKHESLSITDILLATILGSLDIPYLNAPRNIGGNQIFPLNGPQYSLFFEIFANLIWAATAAAFILRKKWAAVLLATTCFILMVAMGVRGGDTPETFFTGFPRVGASFLAGVVIFYLDRALLPWRWWPTIFWICCATMVLTFYAQSLPFAAEMVWVATVSPLLVLSGARTSLQGKIRPLALLAGRLSYPVYILHYPIFVWINGIYQTVTHRRDVIVEGGILIFIVTFSSVYILRYYDEPVRYKLNEWLKGTHRRREVSPWAK